eukprot:TRINITY_DN64914_c0_g2_i1.p1 TRINITY_DN64914_c0_g2~~TRINITY_DN64914_c0_g2_i1.p1  ORF type:complete len:1078 (+),score=282.80 TRINITY_DN64914_c0_g2_i1:107-3340(+)
MAAESALRSAMLGGMHQPGGVVASSGQTQLAFSQPAALGSPGALWPSAAGLSAKGSSPPSRLSASDHEDAPLSGGSSQLHKGLGVGMLGVVASLQAGLWLHRRRHWRRSRRRTSYRSHVGGDVSLAALHSSTSTEKSTETRLSEDIDSIVKQLREIDAIGTVPHKILLDHSGDSIEATVQKLEKLAGCDPPEGARSKSRKKKISEKDKTDATEQDPVLAAVKAALAWKMEKEHQLAAEALERSASGKEVALSEQEKALLARLEECVKNVHEKHSKSGQGSGQKERQWPPAPSPVDREEEAQAARLPGVEALLEARRNATIGTATGLRSAPLRGAAKYAMCRTLEDLLQRVSPGAHEPVATSVALDREAPIAGIVDVADLARRGDVFLASLDARESQEDLFEDLNVAAEQGAAACVVLLRGSPGLLRGKAEQILSQAPKNLGLLILAESSSISVAQLASAYFGTKHRLETSGVKLVGMLGSDALEVRSASWLLYSALERHKADAKAASLLGARRAMVRGGCVELPRPRGAAQQQLLTPCIVHELLSEVIDSESSACVLEMAPGGQTADAFDTLNLNLLVDLGASSSRSTASTVEEYSSRLSALKLAGMNPAGIIQFDEAEDEGELRGDARLQCRFDLPPHAKGFHAPGDIDPYAFETLKQKLEAADLKGVKMSGDAVDDEAKAASEADYLKAKEIEFEHQEARSPLRPGELRREAPEAASAARSGLVCGSVSDRSRYGSLALRLSLDEEVVEVALPLFGRGAARGAVAAVTAAMQLAGGPRDAAFKAVVEALRGVRAAPGVFELMTSLSSWPPKSACLLHEASSPQEVRRALEAVREWASVGAATPSDAPKITAVFSCDGEERRGDRAKCGWALAELCDRVVLTSKHPRREPPMQVLEDVLEAMRATVQPDYATTPHPHEPERLPAKTAALAEVHVVADRTDALKLGVCLSTTEFGPDITIVFGGEADFQEAADDEGRVLKWHQEDRRLLAEILEVTERLAKWGALDEASLQGLTAEAIKAAKKDAEQIDISTVPWTFTKHPMVAAKVERSVLSLPGESLHWSYSKKLASDGSVAEKL